MATYSVTIFPPQELNHSSYVQTGLFELEKGGLIKVEVNLSGFLNKGQIEILDDNNLKISNSSQSKTSFYKIKNNLTDQVIFFAIDLYDHADKFSQAALEHCDFIFKRNFQKKYVEALGAIGKKVHKCGLTFGVHSLNRKKGKLFLFNLLAQNFIYSIKWDRRFFQRFIDTYIQLIDHWKFVETTRPIDMFIKSQNEQSNMILFQTRCFLKESKTDQRELHQQRYRLIKLLQKEFPDQFKGGFISSSIAKDKYSDALTNLSADPREYLETVKKAKVVIYTRGLAKSPAWKMAEYLSLGKVIIAEPMDTELPVPLEEGKELLYFRSNGELIEKVNEVLSNRILAIELSQNARLYYEKHVHPVQNMKRILEFMINDKLK